MSRLATIALTSLSLALNSCREQNREIHITSENTRDLTQYDTQFTLSIKDHPPLEWRRLPGTQFRDFNYLAGTNEDVEIVVGITKGKVLQNANRWLGQFGLTPLPNEQFLGNVTILEGRGYLVEAEGSYAGMGSNERPNYSLVGAICPIGKDSLLTIKMTGPTAEVQRLRSDFDQYLSSMEYMDNNQIPKEHRRENSSE